MASSLQNTENVEEVRADISVFGKMDRSKNPTKLAYNEFYTKENWINKVGSYGSIEKRNGIQRYNTNALSANLLLNLYEAKFDSGYFMLGKDIDLSSKLAYCSSPYTGAWTSISTSEGYSFYRFAQFKNNVYVANRVDGSGSYDLLVNKVWQGGASGYYEHGASPFDTDSFTVATDTTAGGLSTPGYYVYLMTFLYDGFQESAVLAYSSPVDMTGKNATKLSSLNVGGTRVKAKNIYRSAVLASSTTVPSVMYYLTTLTDVTTATYIDVKPDSALGTAIPIQNFFDQKKPYRSRFVSVAKDRLIQANLEVESTRYSALPGADITLTASGGGSLSAGTYKYRFYKCYFMPSGGRFGFIVGNYVEKSITVALNDKVVITMANLLTTTDLWCGYILIQRTKVGTSEFFYLAAASKNILLAGGYSDTFSDVSLASGNANYPVSIIYADENVNNSKYRGAIAISEAGNPDLIPAENVKTIDVRDTTGITGLFSEQNKVIIFTTSARYIMDTEPQSSDFWTIEKAGEHIGAAGQDNATTGVSGHSGILQLPDGNGYIFFSRSASAATTTPVKIYYWNGGASEPKRISDEIYTYINGFSSFQVKGMCYDFVNNWIWIVTVTNSGNQILIYDLNFREWYVFTLDSTMIFYEIVCTEDGKILLGCDAGKLNAYVSGTYQDTYSGGNLQFNATLETKLFDEHDADLNVKQVVVAADSSTAGLAMTQTITGYSQTGTASGSNFDVTDAAGTIHRLKKRGNVNCRRFYLTLTNAQNKNVIINKISIDYKIIHSRDGGQ